MTTLSRLLAMQAQLDKCFREGCVEAMECYERERPLGTSIDIEHSDFDKRCDSTWLRAQIKDYMHVTFRHPERIQISRLEVHP